MVGGWRPAGCAPKMIVAPLRTASRELVQAALAAVVNVAGGGRYDDVSSATGHEDGEGVDSQAVVRPGNGLLLVDDQAGATGQADLAVRGRRHGHGCASDAQRQARAAGR